MIYIELTKHDFREAFRKSDRISNFSYHGLGVLFDYYNELGEDVELDVIEICCEWSELDLGELKDQYGDMLEDCDDIETAEEILSERTTVLRVPVEGTLLVQEW